MMFRSSRTRCFAPLLSLLLVMGGALGWAPLAAAAANCTAGPATITMPDVILPSTTPTVGSEIATSAPVTIVFTCSGLPISNSAADHIATIQAGQTLAPLDATNVTTGPGITFKTNITGLALNVTASPVQATSQSGNVNDGPNKFAGYPVGSVTAPSNAALGSYSGTVSATFVGHLMVTGPITVGSGQLTGITLIPFWWYISGGSANSSSTQMTAVNLYLGASSVRTGSCSVSTASQNLTVTLPNINAAVLNGTGATGGKTAFNINLTCKSSSKDVLITMTASNPAATKGVVLPTSGAGNAGNVGVQILNGSSAAVDVTGATSQTIATSTSNGTLSVPYYAQYYQTGSPVTAGGVTATVTFVMSYQ
ncbi:fimbrial protein [Dyella humicola]|uniref:fimbrial protein n=1 Tax=Dyella humicola TaxID=2992126 RepID=UPI0022556A25|nr:fimbrial protein [Dyella humicola]